MAIGPESSRPERQRYRIEQLMENSNKTKLKHVARLHAALFVGQLFDRAIDLGKKREELEAQIGVRLGDVSVASRDFRIERWRLRKQVTEINDALVRRTRQKSEPQRKEAVYYHVVQVLCEQLNEDPLERQITLRELIEGRADDPETSGGEEVNPAQRVASLLRHMARAFAVEHDLSALWAQARALDFGSDLMRGPIAVPVPERRDGFGWRGEYLMSLPCPSVHLVRVPLMEARTSFDVTPVDDDASSPCRADGIFNLFLAIHLILDQDNAKVAAPRLALVFDHHLQLGETGRFPGFQGHGRTSYGHSEITSLGEFSSNAVDITTPGGTTWFVEATPDWDWDEQAGSTVFSSGYDFCTWKAGAEHFFLLAELAPGRVPVDAHTLTRWLAFDTDGGVLPHVAEWILGAPERGGNGPSTLSTGENHDAGTSAASNADIEPWFRRPGFQKSLEQALHTGMLEAELQEWVEQFRSSLNAEIGLWRDRAENSDARLRERWQNTIQSVTGMQAVEMDPEGKH